MLTLPLALGAAALAACTPDTAPGPRPPSTPPAPSVAPSAARTRRPKPRHASKGIGMPRFNGFGFDELDSLDLDWFYNWGPSYPPLRPASSQSAEFVPMIWGRGSLERNGIEEVLSELPWTGAEHLLGFNEPDHEGQADMSVATAIKLWPQLERAGLRLGSPGAVQAMGDWLMKFMDQAAAKDLRVDFVTMHSYAPPHADNFLEYVQRLHDRYDKPIWITEFAVADWDATTKSPSRFTEKEILAYMRDTVAGLREMPFVERFAWKTRVHDDPIMGASALFRSNGSLTPTGELYRSL
ncbi:MULTISPECIES: glycoside hydrolase family protein [unclassified Arthrobacter]|uniref:glycoside hydrolase family protein n=1 Tax=unclassified Arthrobacter TaxID=235627 RepID=UPI0027D7E89F|nr:MULTISPECIES: glycoside hydrolase family protein [unclassified Arthrobacter]